MLMLRHGRHVCAPPKGTNMATPYKASSINLGDTLLGIACRANEIQQRPNSWRCCLHCSYLSYPRILNLFIEWLRFLVLITWLVKTENRPSKRINISLVRWQPRKISVAQERGEILATSHLHIFLITRKYQKGVNFEKKGEGHQLFQSANCRWS